MKVSSLLTKQAIILLILGLITQIYSLGNSDQRQVHTGAIYPKVYTLEDGNIVVLSDVKNERKTKLSLLDAQGTVQYKDTILDGVYYSASAEIIQPKGAGHKFFFAYHENQEKAGASQREYTMTFGDKGADIVKKEKKDTLDQKTSLFALKSGLVFIASVNKLISGNGESTVNVYLNDPATNENLPGESFPTPSRYVSCFEQKENLVYCAYVSFENVFVSKMKLRIYKIDGRTMSLASERVIKTFFTEFNFLKAIVVNENEAAILFQTGKNTAVPQYGNSGKGLYYYLIETKADGQQNSCPTEEISVKRYDYLFDDCIYRSDPEYYNADIAVLSPTKTYVVCEMKDDRFHGMLITPDTKEVVHFNFNNFDATYVGYPVFSIFGQSMGLFYTINREEVVYQIMNYPDCKKYRDYNILVPIYHFTEIDLSGKVFLTNAYPASRVEEKMYFRLSKPASLNLQIAGSNVNMLENTNYETSTIIRVFANETTGIQIAHYTSAYVDAQDGLVTGRTCEFNIYTPVCLPQCYSCAREGDSSHHYCLGCKVRHFSEEDPAAQDEGFGKPEYCHRCNIACYSCYGNATKVTTNCRRCDYENGYYPFELDERTCFNNETATIYEEENETGLWLDQPDENNTETWIWRICHRNCRKCRKRGNDANNLCTVCRKNYHFYYNQSFDNNTIPGSCIDDCEGNGFYVKREDDKCHPCLANCKVCNNASLCDYCYPNFFNMPEKNQCTDKCPPSLAYDRTFWECVCCKTRYKHTPESPRYNLNQTCVYPMPPGYHIIEPICNTITLCGKGCFECNPWNSTKCTSCFPEFYKEHFLEGQNPDTFHCYDYLECGLDVGGAPINRSQAGLCLNCKLENETFRYPSPTKYHEYGKPYNWICTKQRMKMTYISIIGYNTLGWCYLRCASCDSYGIPDKMNCLTCRESNDYKIFNEYTVARYSAAEKQIPVGDCIHNPPKCNACPYYHQYNDETDKGEDICMCNKVNDVCVTCLTCPEDFPYYVIETRECVETCGFSELLSGACSMTNTYAALEFLRNPFFMENTRTSINTTQMIASIISTTFVQNLIQQYGFQQTDITNTITNIFGSGSYYNLPQSQIIIGNNVSIEFTTFKLELQKLAEIIAKGISSTTQSQSIVQMGTCEEILKQQYSLSTEEDLMIIKGDLIKKFAEYYASELEYQVFSTSLGKFLDLCPCQSANSTVTVTNPFNVSFFSGLLQAKVADEGYDPFDSSSSFYTDVCTPFTNENGNDVLLDDRKADYFNAKIGVCESGCTYKGYNGDTRMYTCECPIKTEVSTEKKFIQIKFDPSSVSDDFYKTTTRSNIKVFKCASQVFSSKGQSKNFGSYILLAGMASFIATFVLHILKGTQSLKTIFAEITSKIANPPKDEKKDYDDYHRKLGNVQGNEPVKAVKAVEKNEELTSIELNSLPYAIAIEKDKRSWAKTYWQYLQNKQLIIFTFITKDDYQLRTVKIALFILFVAFYFAFTALFFNDEIMRQLYKYKGNTDAAVHIPNIILSSLCCLIMGLLIRFVSLSERDISKIRQFNGKERNEKIENIINLLRIKLFVLYGVSIVLIGLCWYYVSAFCAIFKNSQGRYLLNVLLSFIVCNLWPFVLCLIPTTLRKQSLSNNSSCLYKASQIISYF